MKNTLLFFLLFISATVFAQSVTPKDTTYRVNIGGFFYQQREQTFANGDQDVTRRLIGDTSQLQSVESQKIEEFASRVTNDAFFVSQTPKNLRDITRLSNEVGQITGTTSLRVIQAKFDSNFILHQWKITDDSTQNIVFSKNAQGQLRYAINGLPARNATIYGATLIVLNNYRSSGKDVVLYRFAGSNSFQDILRQITLKRTYQPNRTSRSVVAPEEQPATEAKPVTTTKKTTSKKKNR